MGKPITTKTTGICFAFPNVCLTPSPTGQVPIPYPSIGQLSDTEGTASSVKAGGNEVVTKASKIAKTTGDSAGTGGGVKNGNQIGKEVTFLTTSNTVFAEGNGVVRQFDQTEQNAKNCVGIVLGGFPKVLVGD